MTALQTSQDPAKMVRAEISYMRHVHPTDVTVRPALYKVNSMSLEEKVENLSILLGATTDDAPSPLPTNDEVMAQIAGIEVPDPAEEEEEIKINDMIVAHFEEGREGSGDLKWYLGFVDEIVDSNNLLVSYLKPSGNMLKWKRADSETGVRTAFENVLQIAPVGEWDHGERTPVFCLNKDCKSYIEITMRGLCAAK